MLMLSLNITSKDQPVCLGIDKGQKRIYFPNAHGTNGAMIAHIPTDKRNNNVKIDVTTDNQNVDNDNNDDDEKNDISLNNYDDGYSSHDAVRSSQNSFVTSNDQKENTSPNSLQGNQVLTHYIMTHRHRMPEVDDSPTEIFYDNDLITSRRLNTLPRNLRRYNFLHDKHTCQSATNVTKSRIVSRKSTSQFGRKSHINLLEPSIIQMKEMKSTKNENNEDHELPVGRTPKLADLSYRNLSKKSDGEYDEQSMNYSLDLSKKSKCKKAILLQNYVKIFPLPSNNYVRHTQKSQEMKEIEKKSITPTNSIPKKQRRLKHSIAQYNHRYRPLFLQHQLLSTSSSTSYLSSSSSIPSSSSSSIPTEKKKKKSQLIQTTNSSNSSGKQPSECGRDRNGKMMSQSPKLRRQCQKSKNRNTINRLSLRNFVSNYEYVNTLESL
ncbi:hypothetical protein SNEBB_008648 [Seison nebaliae]|nr:hypothetical protein SNEBB_008648 [Seison nebaliae]